MTTYVVAPEHPDYLQVVNETNGQFFDIRGRSEFTTIIDQIEGLIATVYRLVYVSPARHMMVPDEHPSRRGWD